MSGTRASNDRPPGAGGVKRGRMQQEAAATGSRVTVVLGAQWGDEGKGKVVDLLATDADIVSRCQVRAGRRVPPHRAKRAPPPPRDPDGPCPPVLWLGQLLGFLPSWSTCSRSGPHPGTHAHTHPCAHTQPPLPPDTLPTPPPPGGQSQSYKYKSLSWTHLILRGWGIP